MRSATSASCGDWTWDTGGDPTLRQPVDNALTGPIPVALRGLVNLEELDLGWNELTGPVPAWLGDLVRVRTLDLAANELTGPIPGELGSLAQLETLDLSANQLTGSIPGWLGDRANLRTLNLGSNQLTGPIPVELGSLVNLYRLNLGFNDLTGPIPTELGSLVNLWHLSLNDNDLGGPIPAELGNLVNLKVLRLGENDSTGPIPAELGNLLDLEVLDLSYTWGLSGPLPSGLQRSRLEDLDIFVTRTCAPAAWREWLATIEFHGPLCGAGTDVTIDVAVVYTPAAREAAGGGAAIESAIDLMVAETNDAYRASGVSQRVALVARSEVRYTETSGFVDIVRLGNPSDGHLDEGARPARPDRSRPRAPDRRRRVQRLRYRQSPRPFRAHRPRLRRHHLRARAWPQHGPPS